MSGLCLTSNGQYYFNNTHDIVVGGGEVYIGTVFDPVDSTILIHGNAGGDHRPYIYRCDRYGNAIDTIIVENPNTPMYYNAGFECSMIIDHSDNIIIVGVFAESGSSSNAFIVKMNAVGDTIWTKKLGVDGKLDALYGVIQAVDSSYVFMGATEGYAASAADQDFWLVKLDTLGNLIWQNTFGGSQIELGASIDTTNDGGFVIAGRTRSYGAGGSDIYIVKTDSDGNFEWHKWYGESINDVGGVEVLASGNILVHGVYGYKKPSAPSITVTHGIAMELDGNGDQIWFTEMSEYTTSSAYYYDFDSGVNSVDVVSDGYIFSGISTDSLEGIPFGMIIKTDFSGNRLWLRKFKERESANYLYDVIAIPGGDIVLGGFVWPEGSSSQDGWMIRTNCLGFDDYPEAAGIFQNAENNTIILQNQSQRFGDGVIYWGDGWSYTFTEFDDTLISHTYATGGIYSVMLVVNACYHSDTLLWNVSATITGIDEDKDFDFTLFPNPSQGDLTISFNEELSEEIDVSIYALNGKRVYFTSVENSTKIEVELPELATGPYVVEVLSTQGTLRKKLVLQ